MVPSSHGKIPLPSPVASLEPFVGRWVPGQCQQHTLTLLRGKRVPCIPLCAPPFCTLYRGAGRCWPLACPFFVSYVPTKEFILKKLSRSNNKCKKRCLPQPPTSLPNSICFHFQICLICIWFSRCKTDPWGQAIQVFYFSHHCTHRRTEFGIIHFIRGKSPPIHVIFENIDFYCNSTKKKNFSAVKGCCRPR